MTVSDILAWAAVDRSRPSRPRTLTPVGKSRLTDTQTPPRVALIHDFLLDVRGAERVFVELCEMWPEADIYTAVYDEEGTEGRFADRNVHTSFLQRLRPSARTFRALLPLYPAAIESFDLSGYDLVVSSSSAWAHAVLCDQDTVHVSYCHNPFRYAWNDREQTLARRDPMTRAFLRGAFRRWRQWDWIAAQRTNRYVANSRITQARIRAYFGREAAIVHPPVNTERFSPGPVGKHYLIVSELMPHKQIDVAIAAFNRLRLPLVIIGDGPHARRLQRLAGPEVRLVGRRSDLEVAQLTQSARALIVTSVEEFGIAAVEAQAAGRPVIARAAGGVLETVIDGVTGSFWTGGAQELAQAVLEFDEDAVDPGVLVRHAQRFGRQAFRDGLMREVDAACARDARPGPGGRQPLPSTRLVRRAVRDPHR
jgi:glycosyltransferase involved in cell wall biosynthesis